MTTEETEDQEQDLYFERCLQLVKAPEANADGWWPLFLVSALVIFVALSSDNPVMTAFGVIIGLTCHDIGLWVGMNSLGYVDKRMLFLPFLRASLDTQKRPTKGWLRGLVILFGPLPTAIVGFALAIASFFMGMKALVPIGFMVASMAMFSLIPLGHFDGGRLLAFVLFCRFPNVEWLFIVLTSLCTVALGVYWKAWLLVVVAAIWLLGAGRRRRISLAAVNLRNEHAPMEKNLPDLDDETSRRLYDAAANAIFPKRSTPPPTESVPVIAQAMRDVHAQAILEPPSFGASLLLLVLYGIGIVVALIAILATAVMNG